MSRRVVPALLALVAVWPSGARAWTEAAVRSVQAQVVLDRNAHAHVTLHTRVRVHGGWLEGLELTGLDPDLELDPSVTPWALDQDGQRYQPRVHVVGDGRLQISFPGRSPRRGTVILGLAYRTSLAQRATEPLEGEERVRVRWTLPGWSSGLDGVQIDVRAPPGSAIGPPEDEDIGASVQRSARDVDGSAELTWRRAHLPRTTPWTVSIDVPSEAMAEALRAPPVLAPPRQPGAGAELAAQADPLPFWMSLAALLGLLIVGKLSAVAALSRTARSEARPCIPAPVAVRVPVALMACAAGAWLGLEHDPRFALASLGLAVLCAAYRPGAAPPTSRLGSWRAADARWIALAVRSRRRWLAPNTLLDVTMPLGAAHMIAWLVAPWVWASQWSLPVPWTVALLVSLLPLPLVASGTRRAFPCGPADALRSLIALASRLVALPAGVGLRPVVHVDVRGEIQEARVRTVLARRPEGLLRLDLAMGQAPDAGGWHARPVLVLVSRAGSAAERSLAEALAELPTMESKGGRRILRQVPVRGPTIPILARIVRAIEPCPEAPPVARGTAAPQETVRDLPAPHAVGF